MKKLMFAAAVAAGMVGGLQAVESDIVGYDQTGLRQDFKGAGGSFLPVSGDKIDLVDLKVVGYEEICDAAVQCQFLDKDGYGGETYFWYDLPDDELYGWLDGSDTPVADYPEESRVTFKAGEGLWVSCEDQGYSIQHSGRVATGPVLVNLRQDFKMIVNPNPTDCDLADTWITGYEEEGICDAAVQCQFLDKDGYGGETYFWYDLPDDELYGWLDGSDTPIADYPEESRVIVKPGEGLWVSCETDGFDMNFPKPIPDPE